MNISLKIPPLLLTLLLGALMWLVSLYTPALPLPDGFRVYGLSVFSGFAIFYMLPALLAFKRQQTTSNPMTPEKSSRLVVTGIYHLTRNPMYVSFLFALIGWACFLANLFAPIGCLVFVWYMNRFQIPFEEQALERLFGAEYISYKSQVRRWL